MKLHAFDVETSKGRFRAFTRDKARKLLKREVSLKSDDLTISPNQWKYAGPMSTTGLGENDHIKGLHAAIKNQGFVIVSMPPIYRDFFVFDKKLDAGDIRIYSNDRELTEFSRIWHLIEMRPDGETYEGEAPIYVSQIQIPNKKTAELMGLNYERLQDPGFEFHVVRESSETEYLRRGLERTLKEELPKKFKNSGIEFIDISVDSVKKRRGQSETVDLPSSVAPKKNINQRDDDNLAVPKHPTLSALGFLDGKVVKIIGLIAAVLGIVAFFL